MAQILLGFHPGWLGKPDAQGDEFRLQTLVNFHQFSAVLRNFCNFNCV